LHKGHHLLIDCRGVPREICLDDQRLLACMARCAAAAGSTVVSQIRYRFGDDSPPGCTAVVMLDESHCSVHTYADLGLMAIDVFTCGATDPVRIWDLMRRELGIEQAEVSSVERFATQAGTAQSAAVRRHPGHPGGTKGRGSS
jgi:S-adenosylmethionine decarboxylase